MTGAILVQSRRVLLRSNEGLLGIRPAAILLAGERVAKLFDHGAAPQGDVVVKDYGEDLITPAFVNAHTHLAMNFMRGRFDDQTAQSNVVEELYFRIESNLLAEDVRAFTRMGAYESLISGVGLVWDHYYFGDAVAAGLRDVGLAGVVAPTLQDVHGPGVGKAEQALENTLSIAQNSTLASEGIFAALGPHATDTVSPELWSKLARLSEDHGLPLHFHLAQSAEEIERVESACGGSPVELLRRAGILDVAQPMLMAHGIYLSRSDAKAVTSSKRRLVSCPSSQLQFALPARIDHWVEDDIPFLLASDAGNCNDGLNVQNELRVAAGFRAMSAAFGKPMLRVLSSGKSQHARAAAHEREGAVRARARLGDPDYLLKKLLDEAGAMHPRFRAGVIAEGALGNLAVWDAASPVFWPASDPLRALAFANVSHALKQLFVVGRPVVADRANLASLAESNAYQDARLEATRRLDAVLHRAGVDAAK